MQAFETFSRLRQNLNVHVLASSESYASTLDWGWRFDCFKDTAEAIDQFYRLQQIGWTPSDRGVFKDAAECQLQVAPASPRTPKRDSVWFGFGIAYNKKVRESLTRSQRLDWSLSRSENSVHFDISGILLVCCWQGPKDMVKTAYILGFDVSNAMPRSKRERENRYARVAVTSALRGDAFSGILGRSRNDHVTIRTRWAERCEAKWDAEYKPIYLVFTPAFQVIRSRQTLGVGSVVQGGTALYIEDSSSIFVARLSIPDLMAVLHKQIDLKVKSWKQLKAEAEGHLEQVESATISRGGCE
jgi:hypothetical protein